MRERLIRGEGCRKGGCWIGEIRDSNLGKTTTDNSLSDARQVLQAGRRRKEREEATGSRIKQKGGDREMKSVMVKTMHQGKSREEPDRCREGEGWSGSEKREDPYRGCNPAGLVSESGKQINFSMSEVLANALAREGVLSRLRKRGPGVLWGWGGVWGGKMWLSLLQQHLVGIDIQTTFGNARKRGGKCGRDRSAGKCLRVHFAAGGSRSDGPPRKRGANGAALNL